MLGVVADHRGGIGFAAAERDLDHLGVFDDVVIREDVALAIDDRAGARSFARSRHHDGEEPLVTLELGVDVHDAPIGGLVNADIGELFRRQLCRRDSTRTGSAGNLGNRKVHGRGGSGEGDLRVGWLLARPVGIGIDEPGGNDPA